MHIYLAGIGGSGIGPLANISQRLGHTVSGSDLVDSPELDKLRKTGCQINIGQDGKSIAKLHGLKPIDWYVYSSALIETNAELQYVKQAGITHSKRDQFLNHLLKEQGLNLVAIAGTHGKTTTSALLVWFLRGLGVPHGYLVGGKLFDAPAGDLAKGSKWFVYEADEFDRNFLAFQPKLSLISGLDYDHHEIYPTREQYQQAFIEFINQSDQAIIWESDANQLWDNPPKNVEILRTMPEFSLAGEVNRRNAQLVWRAGQKIFGADNQDRKIINEFPGLPRRFEAIVPNLYTDYAHTPPKISGCLQRARELGKPLVILHEPLTNRRQYYIKSEYKNLFDGVKKIYWLPSFLAREDQNQAILKPQELIAELNEPNKAQAAELNDQLVANIRSHLSQGDVVVALSGGGVGGLDSWLRKIKTQLL